MGEKIPIVGYPAREQASEIFAMRLNYSKWKLCMKVEINFSKLAAKIKRKYDT